MRPLPIAIIGYATRLPRTTDARFWDDLRAGRSLLSTVAPDRWPQSAFWHPERTHPGTSVSFAAGSLGDVSGFDAGFFRISPREAAAMDPQQRILLELAWEALDRASLRPRRLRGSPTGVFLGLSSTDYAYRSADDLACLGPNSATGTTASIAANRLSYVFDWHGPSFVVDTACSSGMVAFHQACHSLTLGECDLALAGAISLHLHPYGFLIFSKASMLSPRGLSQPFQAGADGYVRSEGAGFFVLKPLAQARRDGDPILAVVAATGNNTDGYKSGITVPRAEAQAALLNRVYTSAGLDPSHLHYVEAHGTGTAVGDPIELEAVGRALTRGRQTPLPVGSVKSNLGHLETASAVPGLLKAIYCLQRRELPPTIGITEINPQLPLDRYPLDIVRELRPLPERGTLHIGVNSFGFGGANAHALLQSPPRWRTTRAALQNIPSASGPRPLLLTAADTAALRAMAAELIPFRPRFRARFRARPLPDPISSRAPCAAHNALV
ncbi:MAG: beta-ketoacyl synthase N-terminal-like domain-containing protein [Acidithiobacillus sp.]